MILSNKEMDISKSENSFHNIYFDSFRKDMIILLKKINFSFENSSSTYYLSLFYADNIFNLPEFNEFLKNYYEYQKKRIYIILSVCCLIIATKFNESIRNGLSFLYKEELAINCDVWLKENKDIIKECEE